MNFCVNRFQKAIRFACALALTTALAVPATAAAASDKNQVQKAKKAPSAQVAAKKKPVQAKSVAQKKPSREKAVAAKTPAKAKLAKVQHNKKLAKIESKQVNSGSRHARAAAAKKTGENSSLAKGKNIENKVASRSMPSASLTRVAAVSRLSTGERLGLRGSGDALDLNSSVALVIDQDTNEVLFSKNDSAVLPIASLTKLMTGLVIADANLSMDEPITITQDDVDTYKGSSSRLAVGSTLTRGEMMHLALMSSENRAAHALGRTFPGGMRHFVGLMNSKARELGMHDTRYVEPTGLMSQNQSSARDLATLVSVAYERPILRDLSTSPSHQLALGHRTLQYNNSNRLIRSPEWDIGLQKTGYISEAGRCLVMQAKVAGRKVIMVFLDSAGKLNRVQDAERVRRWVEAQTIKAAFIRPQG
ncbi:MAG: serine hydrolase [Hydrogenophaga sp.]|uniref:D-alanyl-D-alanine carboxypeptidase family protein n=1 Tax=Hydrogenophaga sp. TaxID=1904254 RepID=UPI001BB9BAF1|nr:serine hydrolase [Hydrogenophaga sp.]MBS3911095.1 serine hydrolase [Hydrogenophaga sp.]MDO9147274.1 serine hydrolase [Hydrogenophaga sp.]MDO9604824.1 serine hydrolase [Hydrogenophaga sp.]MDP2163860.1 serine hydrolase [Hydrogenophaga sp.]MDP3477326.1 serine hydrolase [Hydrogenophaga sp.]